MNAAKAALKQTGTDIPIFVQVTVETTGTLLVGPDIARRLHRGAFARRAADRPQLRHRSTGDGGACPLPQSQNWPGLISVQPNAGLPELVDGKTH